ncbi:MAG: HDOD domain-containing protein [Desulfotalea sp.]
MFSFFSKKTDPKAELKEVLEDYELPSFPSVVMQILQEIRNPESSSATISTVLALDPGLSVKLLRLANSVAFSPTNNVSNLTQAIALVGISQLESLVLGVGLSKGLGDQSCQWYDPKIFWLASARRAVIASEFAKILCPARRSECFTAAFLQDMALPFLACQRTELYDPILEKWSLEGGDLAEIEAEFVKWDHSEVASWICAEWKMPENIAMAIRTHHGAIIKDYEVLAPVSLVSIIREDEENSGLDEMIEAAQADCGLSLEQIEEIIEPSLEKAEALAGMII